MAGPPEEEPRGEEGVSQIEGPKITISGVKLPKRKAMMAKFEPGGGIVFVARPLVVGENIAVRLAGQQRKEIDPSGPMLNISLIASDDFTDEQLKELALNFDKPGYEKIEAYRLSEVKVGENVLGRDEDASAVLTQARPFNDIQTGISIIADFGSIGGALFFAKSILYDNFKKDGYDAGKSAKKKDESLPVRNVFHIDNSIVIIHPDFDGDEKGYRDSLSVTDRIFQRRRTGLKEQK